MASKYFDDLEQKTTNSNLERGKSYHGTNAVSEYKCVNKRYYSARVRGQNNYRVTIEIGQKGFKAWCACPYDSRGLCKHEVALALALRGNHEQTFEHIRLKPLRARLLHRLTISVVFVQHLWYKWRG